MKKHALPLLTVPLILGGLAFATLSPRSQEMPAPLEQHAFVQETVGQWTGNLTMFSPDGQSILDGPCSESVRALGKFWTVSEFQMEFAGTEFHGLNTFGYDPQKEAFVGTWIDDASQTMTLMEGNRNERTGQLEMEYDQFDPELNAMKRVKQVMDRGEEAYTMTFSEVTEEGDVKFMEISMQRKSMAEAGMSGSEMEKMDKKEMDDGEGRHQEGGREQR